MAAGGSSVPARTLTALLGALAAAGLVVIIASLSRRGSGHPSEVPELIEDCFEQIDRIERALHRLNPEDLLSGA